MELILNHKNEKNINDSVKKKINPLIARIDDRIKQCFQTKNNNYSPSSSVDHACIRQGEYKYKKKNLSVNSRVFQLVAVTENFR